MKWVSNGLMTFASILRNPILCIVFVRIFRKNVLISLNSNYKMMCPHHKFNTAFTPFLDFFIQKTTKNPWLKLTDNKKFFVRPFIYLSNNRVWIRNDDDGPPSNKLLTQFWRIVCQTCLIVCRFPSSQINWQNYLIICLGVVLDYDC